MIHLLWVIPLSLIFWCVLHGGSLKQMPPVEQSACQNEWIEDQSNKEE